MNKIYFLLFLALSCSGIKTNTSELELREYLYFKISSGKPYSGMAFTFFENGSISSKTRILNGVPKGEWFTYGYKGEVFTGGSLLPLKMFNKYFDSLNIKRLSVYEYYETKRDNSLDTSIFIIGNQISIIDTLTFKIELQKTLINNEIKMNNINNVKLYFMKGELEK